MDSEISTSTISVIMPVYNEENYLRSTLGNLILSENEELIVVDGGSTDNTVEIAMGYTDKVFQTKTGRASVMNYGAAQASGNILLFLHADCLLPANGFDIIREILSDSSVAAGGFYIHINHQSVFFRIIEFAANARHRVTSLIYGDQGMFMKKEIFERIGGFADIPIMEDIDISRRLKKIGRINFVKPCIKVSPRRWLNEGPLYTTLRDWSIAFLYTFIKVKPEKLIKYYKDVR